MRKTEIISLLLIVAAIVGLVITFQMEIGSARKWICILSIGLLLLSIDPTLSRLRKTSSKQEMENRVAGVISFIFGLMAIVFTCVALLIYPFIGGVDAPFLFVIAFFGFVLFYSVWSCYFSARGWLSRRLKWLTGNGQMIIQQIGKGKQKMLFAINDKNDIWYSYHPADRMFFIKRTMFLNPTCFKKEFEERKHQFQTSMEQMHIPLNIEISDESCLSFNTSVGILKQDATKENVCRIHDLIRELAKEDYDQHLFRRLVLGDDTIYMETYHAIIIRMLLVSADGYVERYRPQVVSDEPSEHLDCIYWEIYNEYMFDNVQPDNLIEENVFERMWEKNAEQVRGREANPTEREIIVPDRFINLYPKLSPELQSLISKVPQTRLILYYREVNRGINKEWKSWAYEMIEAGYQQPSIVQLAGEDLAMNPFEFAELVNSIFNELEIQCPHDVGKYQYALWIANQVVDGMMTAEKGFAVLTQAAIDTDFHDAFMQFYYLEDNADLLRKHLPECFEAGNMQEDNIEEWMMTYFKKLLIRNSQNSISTETV